MMDRRRKSFYLISAALLLALIELSSFAFGAFFGDGMFSGEPAYFASIDRTKYESWQASPWFDAELGWNTPTRPTTERKKNCLGKMVEYSYQDEHRGMPPAGLAAVALFGDSFTLGDEVDDASTSAVALEFLIDAPVLNFGAGAFGPEQSVLKFERLAARRPLPPVAVLIVMHENIRRVVNSFRPVYFSQTSMRFGLKPYIAGGTWVEAPRVQTYDEFLAETKRRFAEDFWARPRFAFPYSVSLFKAATSNAFYFPKIASRGRPQFSYEYETDNPLRAALSVAIGRWRASVSAQGIKPFVLFVPANRGDDGVAARYVKSLNAGAGETFAFEFDDPAINWKRYNLKGSGECHPSPYGNGRIATFIADKILALPSIEPEID